MIFSQEFEKVIEHLPDTIMKNDVFIKAYGKCEELKMSEKDFFSKLVNELEVEFNYDPEKVKDILGEKYYTDVCSFYSEFDENNVNVNKRPVLRYDELLRKKVGEYFGCLLTNEVWLPSPEEYKKDPFKYVYIEEIFWRCMRKIYDYFFIDAEKTIKYISRTTNNIRSSTNLEYNILDILERYIVINGAMGVTDAIYHSLVREVRWVLEKNIDIDNYNIYMDVDEIEKEEEEKKEEEKKEEEKKEEEKKEEEKEETEKKEEEKEETEKKEEKKEETEKKEEEKEETEKKEDKEDDENLYLIKISKRGCFDAKTNMCLTLESKTKRDIDYWKKKVIDNETMLSPYINLGYQARILLNEKMRKVLCGEGNVAGIGTRLKYLGLLRNGLGDYEAFVIEKQSGFYLTYILMEGMIKNRLLQIKDLKQIEKYQKSKLKVIEKYVGKLLLLEDNVRPILKVIKREFKRYKKTKYILPNRRNQLILIMFRLISEIHSADISMSVANYVMREIEVLQNFSDIYIEKTLFNIDNMLLVWVKKFNCQYDFLMEIMVYMYSYKKTDKRLKYLENVELCSGSQEFVYVDNIMQKAYAGEYSEIKKESLNSPLMLKKMFSLDSECTEQRIQSIINSYIIHGSYPIEFEFTK